MGIIKILACQVQRNFCASLWCMYHHGHTFMAKRTTSLQISVMCRCLIKASISGTCNLQWSVGELDNITYPIRNKYEFHFVPVSTNTQKRNCSWKKKFDKSFQRFALPFYSTWLLSSCCEVVELEKYLYFVWWSLDFILCIFATKGQPTTILFASLKLRFVRRLYCMTFNAEFILRNKSIKSVRVQQLPSINARCHWKSNAPPIQLIATI